MPVLLQVPPSTQLAFNGLKTAPTHPEETKNIIQDVIAEAKKNFKPGLNIPPSLLKDKKDSCFPTYDAHHIEGTNFIAASGPREPDQVAKLIENTAFNKKAPVKKIIALGAHLGADPFHVLGRDFYNYCTSFQKYASYGSYQVKSEKTWGTPSEDNSSIYPEGMIQSTLFIRRKTPCLTMLFCHKCLKPPVETPLNVTFIPLFDMESIDLNTTDSSNPISSTTPYQRRAILWQLFQESKEEKILIHCAAGLGRTGHLILMFEIMKEYEKIFSSEKPDLIAAEIHKILDRIRLNRPGLVLNEKQFVDAIHNAGILYHFGLKQKPLKKPEEDHAKTRTIYVKASGTDNKYLA